MPPEATKSAKAICYFQHKGQSQGHLGVIGKGIILYLLGSSVIAKVKFDNRQDKNNMPNHLIQGIQIEKFIIIDQTLDINESNYS